MSESNVAFKKGEAAPGWGGKGEWVSGLLSTRLLAFIHSKSRNWFGVKNYSDLIPGSLGMRGYVGRQLFLGCFDHKRPNNLEKDL